MRVLVAVAATVGLMVVLVACALVLRPEAPGVACVDLELADHIVHAEPLGASVDLRVESVLQDEDVITEESNDYLPVSLRTDNSTRETARGHRPTDTLRHPERTGRFSAGV